MNKLQDKQNSLQGKTASKSLKLGIDPTKFVRDANLMQAQDSFMAQSSALQSQVAYDYLDQLSNQSYSLGNLGHDLYVSMINGLHQQGKNIDLVSGDLDALVKNNYRPLSDVAQARDLMFQIAQQAEDKKFYDGTPRSEEDISKYEMEKAGRAVNFTLSNLAPMLTKTLGEMLPNIAITTAATLVTLLAAPETGGASLASTAAIRSGLAKGLSAVLEGTQAGGANAQQIAQKAMQYRQENPDSNLSDENIMSLARSGALAIGTSTAAISRLASIIAPHSSIDDVVSAPVKQGLLSIPKAMIHEGLLEEAPQSAVEQLWSNTLAQSYNPNQRVGEDLLTNTAQGALLGGILGGGMRATGEALSGGTDLAKLAGSTIKRGTDYLGSRWSRNNGPTPPPDSGSGSGANPNNGEAKYQNTKQKFKDAMAGKSFKEQMEYLVNNAKDVPSSITPEQVKASPELQDIVDNFAKLYIREDGNPYHGPRGNNIFNETSDPELAQWFMQEQQKALDQGITDLPGIFEAVTGEMYANGEHYSHEPHLREAVNNKVKKQKASVTNGSIKTEDNLRSVLTDIFTPPDVKKQAFDDWFNKKEEPNQEEQAKQEQHQEEEPKQEYTTEEPNQQQQQEEPNQEDSVEQPTTEDIADAVANDSRVEAMIAEAMQSNEAASNIFNDPAFKDMLSEELKSSGLIEDILSGAASDPEVVLNSLASNPNSTEEDYHNTLAALEIKAEENGTYIPEEIRSKFIYPNLQQATSGITAGQEGSQYFQEVTDPEKAKSLIASKTKRSNAIAKATVDVLKYNAGKITLDQLKEDYTNVRADSEGRLQSLDIPDVHGVVEVDGLGSVRKQLNQLFTVTNTPKGLNGAVKVVRQIDNADIPILQAIADGKPLDESTASNLVQRGGIAISSKAEKDARDRLDLNRNIRLGSTTKTVGQLFQENVLSKGYANEAEAQQAIEDFVNKYGIKKEKVTKPKKAEPTNKTNKKESTSNKQSKSQNKATSVDYRSLANAFIGINSTYGSALRDALVNKYVEVAGTESNPKQLTEEQYNDLLDELSAIIEKDKNTPKPRNSNRNYNKEARSYILNNSKNETPLRAKLIHTATSTIGTSQDPKNFSDSEFEDMMSDLETLVALENSSKSKKEKEVDVNTIPMRKQTRHDEARAMNADAKKAGLGEEFNDEIRSFLYNEKSNNNDAAKLRDKINARIDEEDHNTRVKKAAPSKEEIKTDPTLNKKDWTKAKNKATNLISNKTKEGSPERKAAKAKSLSLFGSAKNPKEVTQAQADELFNELDPPKVKKTKTKKVVSPKKEEVSTKENEASKTEPVKETNTVPKEAPKVQEEEVDQPVFEDREEEEVDYSSYQDYLDSFSNEEQVEGNELYVSNNEDPYFKSKAQIDEAITSVPEFELTKKNGVEESSKDLPAMKSMQFKRGSIYSSISQFVKTVMSLKSVNQLKQLIGLTQPNQQGEDTAINTSAVKNINPNDLIMLNTILPEVYRKLHAFLNGKDGVVDNMIRMAMSTTKAGGKKKKTGKTYEQLTKDNTNLASLTVYDEATGKYVIPPQIVNAMAMAVTNAIPDLYDTQISMRDFIKGISEDETMSISNKALNIATKVMGLDAPNSANFNVVEQSIKRLMSQTLSLKPKEGEVVSSTSTQLIDTLTPALIIPFLFQDGNTQTPNGMNLGKINKFTKMNVAKMSDRQRSIVTALDELGVEQVITISNINPKGKTVAGYTLEGVNKLKRDSSDLSNKVTGKADRNYVYVGETPIQASNKVNKSTQILTEFQQEQEAKRQDQAVMVSEELLHDYDLLGEKFFQTILGYVDTDKVKYPNILANSIDGKNVGIDRNFETFNNIVEKVKQFAKDNNIPLNEVPIRFATSVSTVQRSTQYGDGPRNNKLVRAFTGIKSNLVHIDPRNKDFDQFKFEHLLLSLAQNLEQINEVYKIDNFSNEKTIQNILSDFGLTVTEDGLLHDYDSAKKEGKGSELVHAIHALSALYSTENPTKEEIGYVKQTFLDGLADFEGDTALVYSAASTMAHIINNAQPENHEGTAKPVVSINQFEIDGRVHGNSDKASQYGFTNDDARDKANLMRFGIISIRDDDGNLTTMSANELFDGDVGELHPGMDYYNYNADLLSGIVNSVVDLTKGNDSSLLNFLTNRKLKLDYTNSKGKTTKHNPAKKVESMMKSLGAIRAIIESIMGKEFINESSVSEHINTDTINDYLKNNPKAKENFMKALKDLSINSYMLHSLIQPDTYAEAAEGGVDNYLLSLMTKGIGELTSYFASSPDPEQEDAIKSITSVTSFIDAVNSAFNSGYMLTSPSLLGNTLLDWAEIQPGAETVGSKITLMRKMIKYRVVAEGYGGGKAALVNGAREDSIGTIVKQIQKTFDAISAGDSERAKAGFTKLIDQLKLVDKLGRRTKKTPFNRYRSSFDSRTGVTKFGFSNKIDLFNTSDAFTKALKSLLSSEFLQDNTSKDLANFNTVINSLNVRTLKDTISEGLSLPGDLMATVFETNNPSGAEGNALVTDATSVAFEVYNSIRRHMVATKRSQMQKAGLIPYRTDLPQSEYDKIDAELKQIEPSIAHALAAHEGKTNVKYNQVLAKVNSAIDKKTNILTYYNAMGQEIKVPTRTTELEAPGVRQYANGIIGMEGSMQMLYSYFMEGNTLAANTYDAISPNGGLSKEEALLNGDAINLANSIVMKDWDFMQQITNLVGRVTKYYLNLPVNLKTAIDTDGQVIASLNKVAKQLQPLYTLNGTTVSTLETYYDEDGNIAKNSMVAKGQSANISRNLVRVYELMQDFANDQKVKRNKLWHDGVTVNQMTTTDGTGLRFENGEFIFNGPPTANMVKYNKAEERMPWESAAAFKHRQKLKNDPNHWKHTTKPKYTEEDTTTVDVLNASSRGRVTDLVNSVLGRYTEDGLMKGLLDGLRARLADGKIKIEHHPTTETTNSRTRETKLKSKRGIEGSYDNRNGADTITLKVGIDDYNDMIDPSLGDGRLHNRTNSLTQMNPTTKLDLVNTLMHELFHANSFKSIYDEIKSGDLHNLNQLRSIARRITKVPQAMEMLIHQYGEGTAENPTLPYFINYLATLSGGQPQTQEELMQVATAMSEMLAYTLNNENYNDVLNNISASKTLGKKAIQHLTKLLIKAKEVVKRFFTISGQKVNPDSVLNVMNTMMYEYVTKNTEARTAGTITLDEPNAVLNSLSSAHDSNTVTSNTKQLEELLNNWSNDIYDELGERPVGTMSEIQMGLQNSNKLKTNNTAHTEFGLTDKQRLAQNLLAPTLHTAISRDYKFRRKVTALFNLAQKQSKELNKKQKDSLFGYVGDDYLAQFLTMSMVSPTIQNDLKTNTITGKEKVVGKYAHNYLLNLVDTGVTKVHNMLVSRALKDGKTGQDLLTKLSNSSYYQLAANNRAVELLNTVGGYLNKVIKSSDFVVNKAFKYGAKAITKLPQVRFITPFTNVVHSLLNYNEKGYSFSAGLQLTQTAFAKEFNEKLGPNTFRDGLFRFTDELLKTTGAQTAINRFAAKKHYVTQSKPMDNRNAAIKEMQSKFTRNLTTDEHKAIQNGVLNLGIGVSSLKLNKLFKDTKYVKQEIATAERELGEIFKTKTHKNFAINQSKGLGYYLATGEVGLPNQLASSDAINNAISLPQDLIVKSKEGLASQIMNDLATLEAISNMDPELRNKVASLIDEQEKGIKFLVDKQTYLSNKELDDYNNPLHPTSVAPRKGYTPLTKNLRRSLTLLNPDSKADAITAKELLETGWVEMGKSKNGLTMYYNPHDGLNSYEQGALSIINSTVNGLRMKDIYHTKDQKNGSYIDAHPLTNTGLFNSASRENQQIKGSIGNRLIIGDAPLRTKTTTNYMLSLKQSSQEEVEKYLDITYNPIQSLAIWQARKEEESSAMKSNTAYIYGANEAYKNNTVKLGKDGKSIEANQLEDWVFIGPDSDDGTKVGAQLNSAWHQLDEQTQDEALAVNKKGIPVPRRAVDAVTGYKNRSLIEFMKDIKTRKKLANSLSVKLLESMFGPKVFRQLSRGALAWTDLVSWLKENIIVRNLIVPIANIISNIQFVMMVVKDPIKTYRHFKEGAAAIRDYSKISTELSSVKEKLTARLPTYETKRLENQRDKLTMQLMSNPINTLIEAGLSPNVADGIDIQKIDSDSILNKIRDGVEGSKLLPNSAKTLLKEVFMSKDSFMYDMSSKSTGYGDVLGKYVLYKDRLLRGDDNTQALDYVRDVFVNYTDMLPRWLNYSEKLGLTFFTKYALRIQKVIMQAAIDHPTRVASIVLGGGAHLGILESIVGSKDLGATTGWYDLMRNGINSGLPIV